MTEPLRIGGVEIKPGERRTVQLLLPQLYSHTEMTMPVQVIRGPRKGPCMLLCAALHGDELNGMEIVRRVVGQIDTKNLKGTLIAVPIVNLFAFINQSRYLPDRRDLNRSFPGSNKGSMAARVAYLFMHELVKHCTHGVDLHTAAQDRTNLPQLRGNLEDPETQRIAEAFGAPVYLHASTRDGSLREAAARKGTHILVYEGGEALRFNEEAIEIGVNGTMRVFRALGMLKGIRTRKKGPSQKLSSSTWVRARHSGILHLDVSLGEKVKKRQTLGVTCDAFGENRSILRSPAEGVVIGQATNPLVHRGDAVVHVGILDGEGK